MSQPSRAWVFTWNNYPPNAYDQFRAQRPLISSINIGKEVGANGTPHLQGHMVMKSPCRLSKLTGLFPGVHFEIRRGSEQQAKEYTEKDEDPDRLDWDDRVQGSRTDLHALTAIVAADPLSAARNVAREMPAMYVKYHAGVRALATALLQPTELIVQREVFWHFGPTGTGKTYTALQMAKASAVSENDIFVWSIPNFKFAGTYAGQTHVIIDELRTSWEHFSFSGLLSLLGNSRHEVEVKGATVPWRALKIWVTAPVEPKHFACLVGDPIEQLLRRITHIHEFDIPYVAPAAAPSRVYLERPALEFPAVATQPLDASPASTQLVQSEPGASLPLLRMPTFVCPDSDTDDCMECDAPSQ